MDFDEKLFEQLTLYMQNTNNEEANTRRARVIGIPAPGVQVAPGATVRIPKEQVGEGSFLGLFCYLNGDVTVGRHVLIGPHCSVVAGNHKFDPATGWFSARTEQDGDERVVIGDGTWIASGVTVTPGVRIGKCNLICAGSVVTRSTPDYAIMAGVPAVQRGYIDPETGRYCWYKGEKK